MPLTSNLDGWFPEQNCSTCSPHRCREIILPSSQGLLLSRCCHLSLLPCSPSALNWSQIYRGPDLKPWLNASGWEGNLFSTQASCLFKHHPQQRHQNHFPAVSEPWPHPRHFHPPPSLLWRNVATSELRTLVFWNLHMIACLKCLLYILCYFHLVFCIVDRCFFSF